MFKKFGYKFTKKRNPNKGIMSTSLGVIATASICIAVYLAYLNQGNAIPQYGMVTCLSFVFSVLGFVLGIASIMEKDIYRFFPIMGIVFNSIALLMSTSILYLGL